MFFFFNYSNLPPITFWLINYWLIHLTYFPENHLSSGAQLFLWLWGNFYFRATTADNWFDTTTAENWSDSLSNVPTNCTSMSSGIVEKIFVWSMPIETLIQTSISLSLYIIEWFDYNVSPKITFQVAPNGIVKVSEVVCNIFVWHNLS